MGTALTIEQIRLLNRFTNNIITIFDADTAGEAATERGIELLKEYNEDMELYHQYNVNLSAVSLPSGYDPAKFIMEKKDENIIDLVNKAEPLVDFTLKSILERRDTSTISGKLKTAYDTVNFISDLPSRILQEEYIKKVAQKIDMSEQRLFSYLSDVNFWDFEKGISIMSSLKLILRLKLSLMKQKFLLKRLLNWKLFP